MTDKLKLLRSNFREVIIIFTAIAVMAIFAYFFMGRILWNRLLIEAEMILQTTEANVKAGFLEAETILANSYYAVNEMLKRNASQQEILNYLTNTTEWVRRHDQGLFGFYGVYGYINGEFYDSMGINPGSDYILQRRPWYQTAIRSSNTAYTTPYEDVHTGNTVISVVQTLNDNNGNMTGILAVDVGIGWLEKYIDSFHLAQGGYGLLVSQNMTLMTCPDRELINCQLQELGGSYAEIVHAMERDSNISAQKIKNKDGKSEIVFFNRIYNGWYIGSVTPYFQFYRALYISAVFLFLLWIALSLLICYLQMRISAGKQKADENIHNLKDAMLKTIANLVESRDDITGGHIERTKNALKIILDEIENNHIYHEETKGWDKKLLLESSQLHDVGKISINDNILRKPGPLSKEERNEMEKHTHFGEQIIERIEAMTTESSFLKYAKIFAASHHEKWDGSGYPRGLKENEIPILGRIMAIADVYDALTSIRSYKAAYTHDEAVKIIIESSGTHFDPQLIDIFIRIANKLDSTRSQEPNYSVGWGA